MNMNTENYLTSLSPTALSGWIQNLFDAPSCDFPPEGTVLWTMVYSGYDGSFRERLSFAVLMSLNSAKETGFPLPRYVSGVASLCRLLEPPGAVEVLDGLAIWNDPSFDGFSLSQEQCSVLIALVRLQSGEGLWDRWERLWKIPDRRAAAIATAGMRRADPVRAASLLPLFVERAKKNPDIALGEILWAFLSDLRVGRARVAESLRGLPEERKELCRKALRDVGATEELVEELFSA